MKRKKDWNGSYDTNDNALVCARDAKRLADALQLALDIDSETKAKEQKVFECYFNGEGREYMAAFISFCKGGSFRLG
jgi:hypothetical protein